MYNYNNIIERRMLGNMSDGLSSSSTNELDRVDAEEVDRYGSALDGERGRNRDQDIEEVSLPSSSEWTSAISSNIDDLLNSFQPSSTESLADS